MKKVQIVTMYMRSPEELPEPIKDKYFTTTWAAELFPPTQERGPVFASRKYVEPELQLGKWIPKSRIKVIKIKKGFSARIVFVNSVTFSLAFRKRLHCFHDPAYHPLRLFRNPHHNNPFMWLPVNHQ